MKFKYDPQAPKGLTGFFPKGTPLEIQSSICLCIFVSLLFLYKFFLMPNKKALRADKFRAFKLIKKEQISHDTIRVTFENPDGPEAILGLPIGQHISFKFVNDEGKDVIRSYTPTTGDEKKGIVTFVIKVYKPNPPKFPDGGQMSQHVDSLKIGDTLMFRGPKGHLDYKGFGNFEIHKARKPVDKRSCTHIGMIAGGTGLTPMLQIVQAVLRNPSDHTKMYLLLANQTEGDILCREELERYARIHSGRFQIFYTLDRPPEKGWKGFKGFITKEMINECLPTAAEGVQIFMCGPPPMIKFACLPNLEKCGFKENQLFTF